MIGAKSFLWISEIDFSKANKKHKLIRITQITVNAVVIVIPMSEQTIVSNFRHFFLSCPIFFH